MNDDIFSLFSRCSEDEGTLEVSEVKPGPLFRKDMDSGVSI
jgi:hypothetical protein